MLTRLNQVSLFRSKKETCASTLTIHTLALRSEDQIKSNAQIQLLFGFDFIKDSMAYWMNL